MSKKAKNSKGVIKFVKENQTLIAVSSLFATFVLGSYLLVAGYMNYSSATRETYVVSGLRALEDGNYHKAQSYFLKSTHQGAIEAYPLLAWICARTGNFTKALEYSRDCAKHRGCKGTNEVMGYLALLGYGNAQGAGSAIFYFNESLKDYDESELVGQTPLLRMYENAVNYCMSTQDYIRLVNEAKLKGSKIALLLQGDIDFLGENQALFPFSALKLWTNAQKAHVKGATSRLAGLYWHGYGVKRDVISAISMYELGVEDGDPVAAYSLGLIKLRQGDKKSFSEGMSLIKAAAKEGYGPALSAIGVIALANNMDSRKIGEASADIFKQAYDKGDSTGAILYSFMMLNGVGVQKNRTKAFSILYDLKNRKVDSVDGVLRYFTFTKDVDTAKLLKQAIMLCKSIYFGEVAFEDGAPEAYAYKVKGTSDTHSYYTAMNKDNQSFTDDVKNKIGGNYVENFDDPKEVTIDGENLVYPELYQILEMYNPTTGAKPFLPKLVLKLDVAMPTLPPNYDKYNFDLDEIQAKL